MSLNKEELTSKPVCDVEKLKLAMLMSSDDLRDDDLTHPSSNDLSNDLDGGNPIYNDDLKRHLHNNYDQDMRHATKSQNVNAYFCDMRMLHGIFARKLKSFNFVATLSNSCMSLIQCNAVHFCLTLHVLCFCCLV